MMNREERKNIAKVTINADNMYVMGLEIPYDKNIEILLDGVQTILNGIDSVQNLTLENENAASVLMNNNVIRTILNSGMIENPLLFKRWVCAQTFRMLNYKGWDRSKGWDAYMRNHLNYKYQFTMLMDEVKRLVKMEKDGGHDFEIESMFWTFNTIQQIYMENLHYVKRELKRQAREKRYSKPHVKRLNGYYLHVERNMIDSAIESFEIIVDKMDEVNSYSELLTIMKELNNMPILNRTELKCPTWKSVYRGYGGFYTLYNLFGWHGITLENKTMEESITHIEDLLKGDYFAEPWRFHYMLKKVIKDNDFNLSKSISKVGNRRERLNIA